MLWEILVPTIRNDGRPYRTRYHRVWDAKVRAISNGLTILPVAKGQQPFFLKHLDEAKHNFFLEFDRQAKETNVYGSLPNHLYLIDPYMVHRTPRIKRKVNRLFIRITYAFTELQHPKNTINPLFAGQQYHKRVDIRENLMSNEFDPPYHLYGLTKI